MYLLIIFSGFVQFTFWHKFTYLGMEKSNTISMSGDNGTTYIGDNITINNHGPCTEKCHVGQVISGTDRNWML
jgi:hypothetical protein